MKKTLVKEDKYIDSVLRPSDWEDYIGQEKIKKNLGLILQAAKNRNEVSDHLLFYGQPGLGKTTLAFLVAKQMAANLKVTSGTALKKAGDLAAVLSNLENKDILFIDECHRLGRGIEEMLYPAMEFRKLHLVIGKGLGGREFSLDLPQFTLIAATTRPDLLSFPLRSRFGASFRFDYYDLEEIKKIIGRSAEILNIKIDPPALSVVARASRATPRFANLILKRSRDFSQVNNIEIIDEKVVSQILGYLEIDEFGLESHERRLLEAIIKKFHNRPIGINTLADVLGEDKRTVEEIYEPYLIKLGFLERTPAGRVATESAYEYLNVKK